MNPGVPTPGTLRFPRSWLAPLASGLGRPYFVLGCMHLKCIQHQLQ
jgi:hypothetical protein